MCVTDDGVRRGSGRQLDSHPPGVVEQAALPPRLDRQPVAALQHDAAEIIQPQPRVPTVSSLQLRRRVRVLKHMQQRMSIVFFFVEKLQIPIFLVSYDRIVRRRLAYC